MIRFEDGQGTPFKEVIEKLEAYGVTFVKTNAGVQHESGSCEEVWMCTRVVGGETIAASICPMPDDMIMERSVLRSLTNRLHMPPQDTDVIFGWLCI